MLALLWARVHGPELRGADLRLDLRGDQALLVHVSPEALAVRSRSSASRLLGAAMALSMHGCLAS